MNVFSPFNASLLNKMYITDPKLFNCNVADKCSYKIHVQNIFAADAIYTIMQSVIQTIFLHYIGGNFKIYSIYKAPTPQHSKLNVD